MTADPNPTFATRAVARWSKFAALMFALVVILGVSLIAVFVAYQAERGVEGSCQVWHDLASLPLSQSTTKTGLQLVADGRVQFTHLSCSTSKYGQLPPIDPRVAAVLKAQGH